MNPDLLLYDFDGTVYRNDEDFKQHFMGKAREFAEKRGFDKSFIDEADEAVRTGYSNSTASYLVDQGVIDTESEFAQFVFDEIPENIVDNQAARAIEEMNSEYKSGIFTNNSKDAVEAYLDESGLEGCFDVMITYEDLPELKPHNSAFQEALKHLEEEPSRILFIEDSLENAFIAREFGIAPVYIDRSEDYEGEINSVSSLTELEESLE